MAARPDVFTDTLALPGADPEGVTDSHEPPEGVVAAVAVKVVAVPPMVICCAAGWVVLPSAYVKLSEEGVALTVGDTTNDTFTTTEETAPGAEIVMVPL